MLSGPFLLAATTSALVKKSSARSALGINPRKLLEFLSEKRQVLKAMRLIISSTITYGL